MEWIEKALPYIWALLTGLGGWLGGRAMQKANVTKAQAEAAKTEAEAQETLARATKILSESDSIQDKAMADALGAWRDIADARNEEALQTRVEVAKARAEAREANNRSKETERKYNLVLEHAERLEDLLSLAVTFIDTLVARMKEANITPPVMPKQLTDWVSERNGKGKGE